ncbi:MAG: CpXC domain-containing protein [Treponema sp.]|jgi:hypothetical protein|nr:CpXC domain-containing protein [Treponema sp.]
MKRKLGCICEHSFFVEVPETINLDDEPARIAELSGGAFCTFPCPACGKLLSPEFPLLILWPSKKTCIEVIPEADKGAFLLRKKTPREVKEALSAAKKAGGKAALETVLGYADLACRIAQLRDGLEPAAAEAVKLCLYRKAVSEYPGRGAFIRYTGRGPTGDPAGGPGGGPAGLEFRVYGIKDDETAVITVPMNLYEDILNTYQKHPHSPMFRMLRAGSWLSARVVWK